MQHYRRVTRRRLREWNIRAIVISGNSSDWIEYDADAFDEMFDIIRSAEWPIFGICGGHQLIGMAHGAPLGPMRELRPGEVSASSYAPAYFKEWGFTPVRIVQADPIFDGLGAVPIFAEAHYWEIKELPAGFELLASTDECPIEAMRQRGKPIYGVQFHPEAYSEYPGDRRSAQLNDIYAPAVCQEVHPDGRQLLENFFKIAGVR